MGLKELSLGRSDMHKIDPRVIVIEEGWNARDMNDPENIAHVAQLKASIKEVGVKTPLRVVWKDGQAVLREGHCRMTAVMQAIEEGTEIKTVPVMVEDRKSNDAEQILGQIVSNSGKQLSQLEAASVCARLLDLGWQARQIADKTGMTAARISQLGDLHALPERLKGLIKTGKVSASYCLQLFKEHGKESVVYDMIVNASEHAKEESGGKRQRAMPKDMGESDGEGGTSEPKKNLKTVMKDFFDACEIDNGEDVTEIKVATEDFEVIRQLLKL